MEFAGLSYVTFRGLDVIIGIEDRLITTLSANQYLLFVVFFPTISSGPIDRFRRFATAPCPKTQSPRLIQDIDAGVQRIMRGFLYKFLVAALIKTHWLEPARRRHGIWSTLSYMYAYTLYLFFDFAGYSAFAIGVGYMLGIRTPENFRLPFLARNINDFWNRWHISLSDLVPGSRLHALPPRGYEVGSGFRSRDVASIAAFLRHFSAHGAVAWRGTSLCGLRPLSRHRCSPAIACSPAGGGGRDGRERASAGEVASTAFDLSTWCVLDC